MKTKVLALLVLAQISAFAAEKKVKSKIDAVTVFFQGAQVSRSVTADIPKGETEIVLSQLEGSINNNSIQVQGDGGFIIKSYFLQTNYLEPKDYSEELRGLEKELKRLNRLDEELKLDITVLNDEEKLILNNQKLAGQQNGVEIEELKKAAEFYKTRLKEIRVAKLELNRKVKENNKALQKIKNQMGQIRTVKQESVEELVVKVESDRPQKIALNISYYVANASWSPFYEVNIEDVSKPIGLVYKSNVSQNTGVNWEDVELTLSTSQPNLSGQLPSLNPWYLNFVNPQTSYRRSASAPAIKRETRVMGSGYLGVLKGSIQDAQSYEALPVATVVALDASGNVVNGSQTDFDGNFSIDCRQTVFSLKVSYIGYETKVVPVSGNYFQIQLNPDSETLDEVVITKADRRTQGISANSMRGARSNSNTTYVDGVKSRSESYQASQLATKATFFEYKIEGLNTVMSDNLSEVVHIQDIEINAKYEYQCIPKIEKDVFLIAKIFGWEEYNLLNGSARLYFENTFVGESFLDVQSTQDTLGLSLGRDKNILVSRDKVLEKSGPTVMGDNKKETREFKIQVRNNKSAGIKVKMFDQIPVSKNKKISVKLEEDSDAKLSEQYGLLTWYFSVGPAENKEYVVRYSVVYPNGQAINLTE